MKKFYCNGKKGYCDRGNDNIDCKDCEFANGTGGDIVDIPDIVDNIQRLTVKEYAKLCRSPLKIMSAYNGKVLCREFDEKKHAEIAEREIVSVWAEITVSNGTFGNFAKPIMCAYVNGEVEYHVEIEKNKVVTK